MKDFIGIISLFIFIALVGSVGKLDIEFTQSCEGYLKRAADANTVSIAKEELGKALKYLKDNDLTHGSTHILYKTPSSDLGFLYKNLTASYKVLDKASKNESLSNLEESNILIKLRESLLDRGSDGDHVSLPKFISLFPYQDRFFIWFLFGLPGLLWLFLFTMPKKKVKHRKW